MSKLLFPAFLLFGFLTFGQISFYKQFSNNGYDYGEGITQMADSSYLITGSSSSFLDGPAQAFILKLDSLGNFKWSKHFGGAESDGGKRIMCIENDGILVAGFTNSSGLGAYDFFLFKTDLNGNLLWENTYGTSSWDKVYDAALTRDSGVIMVGETLNTSDGEPDILIVRTDKNGNELWAQQIGSEGEDYLKCIEKLDDSTFVLGGTTFVSDSMLNKGFIMKLEDTGGIWWQDTVGLSGDYVINDISFVLNQINVVGRLVKHSGDTSNFRQKYNLIQQLLIDDSDSNPGEDYSLGIVPYGTNNNFLVAITFNNSFSFGGLDIAFQSFAQPLFFLDNVSFVNYAFNEYFGHMISTLDSGAIAVGYRINPEQGGANIFVVKMYEGQPLFNSGTENFFESLVHVNEVAFTDLRIYPNPSDGNYLLNFDSKSSPKEIKIYNALGQLVQFEVEFVNSDSNSLKINSVEQGVYLFTCYINENLVQKRLILMR